MKGVYGRGKRHSKVFQLMNKLINANDIHRRERDGFQYIEVMVFCYDVSGIGYYRTIHELVIILIGRYQVEVIMRYEAFHVTSRQQGIDNRFGHPWIDISGYDLLVFFNDFIGDTQCVVSTQESPPHFMVMTSRRNGHNEAVGIKYNMLHNRLFVRSTLMQMTETFYFCLVQGAVLPKAVYLFLGLPGEVVGHNLHQF